MRDLEDCEKYLSWGEMSLYYGVVARIRSKSVVGIVIQIRTTGEKREGKAMKILNFGALGAAAVLSMFATGAVAQVTDITGFANQANGQLTSLANLAGMIAFLSGFVFGILGFMKLRANAQNPNDPSNKVSTAFMLIFIGAGLIAVPTVMGVGVQSLFGDKGNTTNLNGDGGGFIQVK